MAKTARFEYFSFMDKRDKNRKSCENYKRLIQAKLSSGNENRPPPVFFFFFINLCVVFPPCSYIVYLCHIWCVLCAVFRQLNARKKKPLGVDVSDIKRCVLKKKNPE